jgi:hypothetical protein
MLPGRAAVLPGGAAAPHVSSAGECAACRRGVSALDARRRTGPADRAGFLKYIDLYSTIGQIIENNNSACTIFYHFQLIPPIAS